MYRIHQIKLKPGESTDRLPQKILKQIGSRDFLISEWRIVKESIDARDKQDIRMVYAVDFTAVYKKNPKKQVRLAANPKLKLELAPDLTYRPAVYEGDSFEADAAQKLAASEREASAGSRTAWQETGKTKEEACTNHLPTSSEEAQPQSAQQTQAVSARILEHRPIVVGFGPAGMFAALILAQAGLRPLVLERGQDVDARTAAVERFWQDGVLNVQSNVQFGEGGAGTFSDGKLTTGIKDVRIRKVLEEFVAAGAPEEILYKQKPHIGTDILRVVVKNIREEIKRLGGEVRFHTLVEDLRVEDGRVSGVICKKVGNATESSYAVRDEQGDEIQNVQRHSTQDIGEGGNTGKAADGLCASASVTATCMPCQTVVFAMGHSARDTFRRMHARGIAMTQKPFSVGVRIEHPQDLIDIAQYGAPGRELGLPPADYKLSWRCENGRGVYTFCMCPGGKVVIASSQAGGVVTNGMSYHDRASGTANSALLCDVRTSDFGSEDVLAGVAFQEKLEHQAFLAGGSSYAPPRCTWGELRDGKAPQVESCLPDFAIAAMREAMPHLGRKLHGFDDPDAMMTAVETRSSSPVRFVRNAEYEGACSAALTEADTLQAAGAAANTVQQAESAVPGKTAGTAANETEQAANAAAESADIKTLIGFYPCGEGAGYAGGIMSAAVDGIRIAETIIRKWRPVCL